jgi:NADP-dependent 3-hydroxy acid dehydrogenase YdfG
MPRPVLLIAGGGRGIGASTARLAGERGYDVAINYLSNTKAAAEVAAAVKKSGGNAVTLQGDMAKEDDIVRVFGETTRALGPITHFVHSAGIGGKNSRLDVAMAATIREVIDVNLFGALISCREAVRRMSTAHGGTGGSIVLLSSIASVTGGATEYVFYAAAKGGVDALTNGLAREVAKEGIPRQRHPAGSNRHRDPRAGTAGAHHAASADGTAGPAGRDCRGGAVSAFGCGVLHFRRRAQRFGRALKPRPFRKPIRRNDRATTVVTSRLGSPS